MFLGQGCVRLFVSQHWVLNFFLLKLYTFLNRAVYWCFVYMCVVYCCVVYWCIVYCCVVY